MTTRWGIIGCGHISDQFACCLRPLADAKLVAVASQTPEKSTKFAEKFDSPKAYDSYEQLVKDPDVDIVYIGTTHNFHYEHTMLALENNKHVLCEKPISLNAQFTEKMIAKAGEKNLFLMEAVWTRFLPATLKLLEVIWSGDIGEVHVVNADFSIIVPFDREHRLYNPELGGGALLDLGIYPLTFAQVVFDQMPVSVQTTAMIGKTGVDETSSYLLGFEGGKTAVLSSSCRSDSPHLGLIIGSKGYIEVPDFYHPQEFTVYRTEFKGLEWSKNCTMHYKVPYDLFGYGHEALEVMRCLKEGLLESPLMPWSLSLEMMKLMDEIRNQWEMVYPGEN